MTGLFMTAGALMGQGLFARTYGGDSSDGISYLIQTQDGGYAVAGWTKSFGAGDYDFLVVKLASDGSLDWARTFGGDTTDYAISVVQTSDGGFAVGGRTWSYGAGYNDFLVLKLDNAGSLQWAKTFGGTASLDYADCMIQTTDGGFAITGESSNFVTWSCLILKLDNAGNMQWARTSDIFGDQVCSMVQASDGGYAILGHTPGSQEMLVLKIDQAGSFSWARVLDGTRSQTSTGCIIQTSDGGYAAAKSTNNFGAGSEDCLVVKLDPSGNLSWARTIGGPSWDNACSFIQTSDGGYAMVGVTRSFGAGGYDLFLVKLDSAGNLSWARTFGGTGYDQGYSLIQTPDKGYALAGYTESFGAGGYDLLFMRLDSTGDYPSCVLDCSPTLTTISPSLSSPTGLVLCRPDITIPDPVVTTPSLTITDACSPTDIEEHLVTVSEPGIVCLPVSGGVIFLSPEALNIRIYSADGRLACSGQLQKGKNRIFLETGVYLWQAGIYKGKVVVK